MQKEYLYIIDPNNYKGRVENIMNLVPTEQINKSKVHCCDETFEEYNKRKGGNLVALDAETFFNEYYKPFLKSMQGPFIETTKENFYDGLNCLPPLKWNRSKDIETFFVGEPYSDNIYNCYVRIKDKYYSALRAITTNTEDLINLKNVE